MKYQLKIYSIFEFGQRKDAQGNSHQEDCTYPLPDELKDSDRTFVLCDGMGGHDAGEVASATVCQAMGDYILNDGHDAEGIFTDDDLKNAVASAFDALDKKDNGAEKKMGTTMTFLKLHKDGATIAHIGDSRVYHIRPGNDGNETQILFETSDHSLVNDLIKIGELTKEEARHSRQKNVITRAMQPNMEHRAKADIKHITDIKAGDFFYMCSDGMLEQEEMEDGTVLRNIFSELVGSDEEKVAMLKSATEYNRDNHTAFIIHVTDVIDPIESSIPVNLAAYANVGKFTAIVEEDQTPADTVATHLPLTTSKGLKKKDGDILPKQRKSNIKRLWSMALYFAIAAFVVAAIIVGITIVKSGSSDKDKQTEVGIERKSEEAKEPNDRRERRQPSRMRKAETESDIHEHAAVQAPNSSATDNLPSGTDNSQQEAPLQSLAIPAVNLSNSEDVINSDAQVVLDNTTK